MSSNSTIRDSLVQYEAPNEISNPAELQKLRNYQNKRKNLPPIESKPDYQSILKAILPPREWDHEGKHYIQYVSHNVASRDDVTALQNKLDERLLSRQARESGICPIREELHSQCFDEIIRQVTIDCPERGLLLMRVRDELKMTIAAYQTLYKSAVSFGMRKQVQAEEGKEEVDQRIRDLQAKKQQLIDKKKELENKKKTVEKRIEEKHKNENNKMKEEIDFLSSQKESLLTFFNSVTEKN